jgi:hypothetical protein
MITAKFCLPGGGGGQLVTEWPLESPPVEKE